MSAVRLFDKFQKLLDVTWPSIADGQLLKRSGTNIIGVTATGGGDVTGQASSVDSEVTLFSGTGGKTIKRATGTGLVNVTSGVYQTPLVTADIAPPIGSVLDFGGSSAPIGWLFCDGSSLLRAGTYANLFGVIGVTYGSADGTHFTLPDLRGRVVAGKDNMGGTSANRLTSPLDGDVLGTTGGAESHQLTIAQMPAHTHTYSQVNAGTTALFSGGGGPFISGVTGSTGGDQVHPIIQPTIIMNKIIKY